MSRPFKNNSGKKAFGVFSESLEAGDYINRKKTKTIYFNKGCIPFVKIGTESNLLLYKSANRCIEYPCKNAINKANLNINLITELDLKDVPVISNVNTGNCPTPFLTTDVPYLDYNIDPSGNLFGNTICGINNYVNYMVYTKR
jgi:hypothetical protein